MSMNFFYSAMAIEPMLLRDKPTSVLEVSRYSVSGSRYGRLAADCMRRVWGKGVATIVDRIDADERLEDGPPYRDVLPLDAVSAVAGVDPYDVIIEADFLEMLDDETRRGALKSLLAQTVKRLIVIAPLETPKEELFTSSGGGYQLHLCEAMPEDFRVISLFPQKDGKGAAK